MMNAILVNYNGTFAENAKQAGIVTLLGMVAIFAVLAILWGVIELLHQGVNLPAKRKARKTPVESTLTAPVSVVEEPNETDDGAIVAAIVAAITAARTEAGETAGFRVVSFRRTTR